MPDLNTLVDPSLLLDFVTITFTAIAFGFSTAAILRWWL